MRLKLFITDIKQLPIQDLTWEQHRLMRVILGYEGLKKKKKALLLKAYSGETI